MLIDLVTRRRVQGADETKAADDRTVAERADARHTPSDEPTDLLAPMVAAIVHQNGGRVVITDAELEKASRRLFLSRTDLPGKTVFTTKVSRGA